jgi:hypothetical protein
LIEVTRETKRAPQEVERRMAGVGGSNRYGEPNFRVVWGWSRLTWIGGKWTDRDASGNITREAVELRQVPKYAPHDRWHLERWMPPEAYGTPEEWHEKTLEAEDGIRVSALGPYPARGEYEHCFTLQDPQGKFLPLNVAACDNIVRAIEWARAQPRSAGRQALGRGKRLGSGRGMVGRMKFWRIETPG